MEPQIYHNKHNNTKCSVQYVYISNFFFIDNTVAGTLNVNC